ncbi:hypothetical protein [Saccharopolyspora phatthalungensis]|uniref:Uncharacterized protein n=1 Tax=Saccharopolyspora phatthalungensis TaxID=664693 RepID=A0A840Q6N7_9PSEU|nr:hypothetical protein [Saccharopolyspora phatthalungensis]MBB5155627.1 hypothetical protein [Saccharopolyspora phatthalungensis]
MVWTDHLGFTHERKPGTIATSRCGLNMGISNEPPCARPCRKCLDEALQEESPPDVDSGRHRRIA